MCLRHPDGWRKNYNMLYYNVIQIKALETVEVRRKELGFVSLTAFLIFNFEVCIMYSIKLNN